MKGSLHEDYGREEAVAGPSERAFGLTVGGILLALAAGRTGLSWWAGAAPSWLEGALAGVGLLLVLFGLAAPALLAPLNRAWTGLGLLLFKVVNPVVLGLIYLTTVVPIGLLLRLLGRDLLHLRRDPAAPSYWVVREPPGPAPDTMPRQF